MTTMNKLEPMMDNVDVGDCNRLLDGDENTGSVYKTVKTSGFVLWFKLPRPTTVEAIETFVKKSNGHPHSAAGYAAPRISVKVSGSNLWQAVYSNKDVWGQFDAANEAVRSFGQIRAAAFSFDHWNVHKFYTVMDKVTHIKMDLFGEISSQGHNTFSMDELRIISPDPVHSKPVPAVHEGPGHYLGCFQDHTKRDFPISKGRCNFMTPKECNNMCTGYEFYSVQFHGECRCGDKNWVTKYHKVDDSKCNSPCNGDISIMCGGGWLNSVYKADKKPVSARYNCIVRPPEEDAMAMDNVIDASLENGSPPPRTKHVPSSQKSHVKVESAPLDSDRADNYGHYVGCFKDDTLSRDFQVLKGHHTDLTPGTCNTLCAEYAFFALQDGNQCRCAEATWVSMYGKTKDTECNVPCSGNHKAVCGGKLRNTAFEVKVAKDTHNKKKPPQDGIQSHPLALARPEQKSAPSPPVKTAKIVSSKVATATASKTQSSGVLLVLMIVAILGALVGIAYVYKQRSQSARVYGDNANNAVERKPLVADDVEADDNSDSSTQV